MLDKAVKISWFILLSIIMLGSLFKMQHWPGGGLMVVTGTSLFLLVGIPLSFISQLLAPKEQRNIGLAVISSLSLWILGIGLLFKIQHWPGGSLFLVLGIIVTLLILVPVLAYQAIKKKQVSPFSSPVYFFLGLTALTMVMTYSFDQSTSRLLSAVNASTMLGVESLKGMNHRIAKDGGEKVKKIHKETLKMVDMIERYKTHLIMETAQVPESMVSAYYEGQIMQQDDNYDVPTRILIGDSPASPRTGEYSARELREALDEFSKVLCEEADGVACEEIKQVLNPDNKKKRKKGSVESWEISNFYHWPLGAVIENLSNMQMMVLTSEAVAISTLQQDQNTLADEPY